MGNAHIHVCLAYTCALFLLYEYNYVASMLHAYILINNSAMATVHMHG